MKKFLLHRPKQIEYIPQRRKTDCGIACAAMICGLLYDDIMEIFKDMGKSTRGGLYPNDMFEILEEMGYECKENKSLPSRGCALVALEWNDPDLSGHYVVWDGKRNQFLDPIHGLVNKSDILRNAELEEIWRIVKIKE